jgi:hypothetical protein
MGPHDVNEQLTAEVVEIVQTQTQQDAETAARTGLAPTRKLSKSSSPTFAMMLLVISPAQPSMP